MSVVSVDPPRLPVATAAARSGVWTALPLLAAAGAALVVALRAPLATTVIGLVTFGIVHNFFELRYVVGRFDRILTGRLLRLLLAGISAIALLRLGSLGDLSLRGEIIVGFALLAVVLAGALQRRPVFAAAGLVLTAGAAAVSLRYPPYHFVVLAHIHNLVPLLFLWEWARTRFPSSGARTFQMLQLAWVVVIPFLLLVGLFDPALGQIAATVPGFTVDPDAVTAAYTPPAWRNGVLPLRFLTAFAFLQTMHYVVWCWFMPRNDPEAVQRFEGRRGVGRLLTGRRFLIVAVCAAAFFTLLFVTDFATGRSLYGAVATYHAYLEFPVLLGLVLRATTLSEDSV